VFGTGHRWRCGAASVIDTIRINLSVIGNIELSRCQTYHLRMMRLTSASKGDVPILCRISAPVKRGSVGPVTARRKAFPKLVLHMFVSMESPQHHHLFATKGSLHPSLSLRTFWGEETQIYDNSSVINKEVLALCLQPFLSKDYEELEGKRRGEESNVCNCNRRPIARCLLEEDL